MSTYTATPKDGTGKATVMHDRRAPAIEKHVGVELHPGTLNLWLDQPFDWTGSTEIAVPDAVDWDDLDGGWFTSSARVKRVEVAGVEGWAVRMERSRAGARLIEVVASVRIRDVVEFPAEVVA